MVVLTSASSPKRRRMDDAQRTAQQIADTNATLQMFTSKRQNRWMQALGQEGAMRIAAPLGNSDPAGRGNSDHQQTSSHAHNHFLPPNGPPALNVNTHAGQTPSDNQTLVDYESPYTAQMPTPLTAAAALLSRPPSAAGPRPGLPSPAPSDEHANSPVNAIFIPEGPDGTFAAPGGHHAHMPAKRPRGRPRKHPYPDRISVSHISPTQSPTINFQSMAMPNTPSQLPPNMRVPTPTSSNLAPAARRANSLAHTTNATLSPLQTNSPMQPRQQGLFDTDRMQRRLNEFFGAQGRTFNPVDEGRRTLAQEAIGKQDHFYLILSQVFCLYTCAPRLLPKQLGRVHTSSWEHLDRLLCSNQSVSPAVLKWFAEFPAPVHIVYASRDSELFINQLVVIESFLQELPRRWVPMIETSKQILAPPLTQDLVEQLYLISPVLQTTAFRAIARAFWGEDNPGLQYLESLHKIDQHTYTHQLWRRNDREKGRAYEIYAQIYNVWCSSGAPPGAPFVPPASCSYFHHQPPSMTVPNNDSQPQLHQGAAQQRQLMEMNQRMLAQQQQPLPGLTAIQQRAIMQNNNRGIAQSQGLAPGPLHHLQYQPNQANQQRLHDPSVLPSNAVAAPHQIHAPTSQGHLSNLMGPALKRLLPPENALPRALPVQPDTVRVSLHQAHLRSPLPASKQLQPDEPPKYRHVVGYALSPFRLDSSLCAQHITFAVTQDQIDAIPITLPGMLPGEPGVRVFNEGSIVHRLRCSKLPPNGKGFDTEGSWVTAENIWPENMSFELNGTHLEQRRKLHFGRYLPIDVSPLLHAGENVLNVYTIPYTLSTGTCAVAIEAIGVSTHTSILAAIPTISSQDSLDAIKRSLASPQDEDDDDFVMTSSTLTIPLFDPYRADRICDLPVRGASCLHRDCFDLETFLSQCKREEPGQPCIPDCWRCPICKGDVRPQTLVKDGFLMHVREELEKQNQLSTRAILVEADGSWKPRAEAQAEGVRSASLEREEAAAAAMAAASAFPGIGDGKGTGSGKGKHRVVEVIELD